MPPAQSSALNGTPPLHGPAVVLAYHGIADVPPPLDPNRLFVAPGKLRAQVRRLRSRGYEFLAMRDFAGRLRAGSGLRRVCALTFDDGVHDGLPETLESLGVPGTIYICPDLMGRPYPWCDPEAGVRLMTQDEAIAASRSPMVEIGSHTNRHTELDTASSDGAYGEMAESKKRLERMLGQPVDSFAYPRCHYSSACPSAARRAGYTSAVTCGPRGSWDPFELRRESMHTPDGPLTFAFKSRGLYYVARDLAPFRLGRWLTRPYRHRGE